MPRSMSHTGWELCVKWEESCKKREEEDYEKSESEREAPKSKDVPKLNDLGLPGGAEMLWHAVGSS
jgi:hypothetical protein